MKEIILKEHTLDIDEVIFWTDSLTTLQWIQNNQQKQQVFVANRTSEILQYSNVRQWRHVPGKQNPADLGTRGLRAKHLLASEWLTGPAWLLDKSNWPPVTDDKEVIEEGTTAVVVEFDTKIVDWSRFSTFKKCRNVVARLLTWLPKYRSSKELLKPDVLQAAETSIWRLSQRESFPQETEALQKYKPVSSTSRLVQLVPFIDGFGVMRSRGRLQKALVPYETKHPIVLDSKHPSTRLFLTHSHETNSHEGVEYVRSVVQQSFWILGLRNALRRVKNACAFCRKQSAGPDVPLMANLPNERVSGNVYPFTNTGVDYFGPVEVIMFRRRLKRWCCLFTCLVTRAVHLEVVPDLTADSCVAALQRFISRRGQPKTIISDNGTNFVGTKKEFDEMFKKLERNQLISKCSQKGID